MDFAPLASVLGRIRQQAWKCSICILLSRLVVQIGKVVCRGKVPLQKAISSHWFCPILMVSRWSNGRRYESRRAFYTKTHCLHPLDDAPPFATARLHANKQRWSQSISVRDAPSFQRRGHRVTASRMRQNTKEIENGMLKKRRIFLRYSPTTKKSFILGTTKDKVQHWC